MGVGIDYRQNVRGMGGIHRMLVLLIQVALSFNKSGRSEIVPIQ